MRIQSIVRMDFFAIVVSVDFSNIAPCDGNNGTCSDIDARLTCVNDACVPKGDSCDNDDDADCSDTQLCHQLSGLFQCVDKTNLYAPGKIIVTVMRLNSVYAAHREIKVKACVPLLAQVMQA